MERQLIGKAGFALCALALVAGCKPQDQSNAAATNSVAQSAQTQTVTPAPLSKEQALALMKERHDGMESIGKATKAIGGSLKSASPDIGTIGQSAARIAELAPKVQSWFPDGSGPDVGKTRAKGEIWQKPEDFTLKANDFKQAAQELDAAAQRGDLANIKSSFSDLGNSCKACHDSYRAPEKR